ncbi:PREDICTED: ATP-dependent DNA helicase PIF1-like [Priapulus caudatus]|uniref:ATP-dependent DNA helicase n=1 Tax=Priapulus caudatus TaxID=37621 RepID=A0ABM1F3W4_PRICU|nr:PREDICTED: ATP-dependent DNA helicase PIF1-like [Priapulus caudatus]
MGDGRYSAEHLAQLITTDHAYTTVRNNIMSVDTILIDEVSMLSLKTLETLETVCRKLRSSNLFFGGLQIILTGDFYQLPPVPNPEYGDHGQFCFLSDAFICIQHQLQLVEVLRQQDDALITCINELARGEYLSQGSCSLLAEVARSLKASGQLVLFARNFDAELFNADQLSQLPGKQTMYTATDTGNSQALKRRARVPKYVALKVGAPVVLTTNLSEQHFNGLLGTVSEITPDGPLVKFSFQIHQQAILIRPHLSSIFSPAHQKVIATRKQLPLLLAFAMTIHKCQGMTLSSVEVHCQHIIAAGQLGVAVGRVTSRAGL